MHFRTVDGCSTAIVCIFEHDTHNMLRSDAFTTRPSLYFALCFYLFFLDNFIIHVIKNTQFRTISSFVQKFFQNLEKIFQNLLIENNFAVLFSCFYFIYNFPRIHGLYNILYYYINYKFFFKIIIVLFNYLVTYRLICAFRKQKQRNKSYFYLKKKNFLHFPKTFKQEFKCVYVPINRLISICIKFSFPQLRHKSRKKFFFIYVLF